MVCTRTCIRDDSETDVPAAAKYSTRAQTAPINMRLEANSDATACGSPSSATSSGPPSAGCAPTPDASLSISSVADMTCACSRRRIPPDTRGTRASRTESSGQQVHHTLGSHPPYYFMPGLLKMARLERICETSMSCTRSGTTSSEPCSGPCRCKKLTACRTSRTPVYTLNPSNWQRRSFDAVMGGASCVRPLT